MFQFSVSQLRQYVGGTEVAWIWLLWLISQAWISYHTWKPKCERLAATDKLFAKPWYAGVLVDQSMLLNRTKDEDVDIAIEVKHIHSPTRMPKVQIYLIMRVLPS